MKELRIATIALATSLFSGASFAAETCLIQVTEYPATSVTTHITCSGERRKQLSSTHSIPNAISEKISAGFELSSHIITAGSGNGYFERILLIKK